MALTSVVPSFPPAQSADSSNNKFGLPPHAGYQKITIPHSSPISLVGSPDASNNLLLSTPTPTAFFTPSPIQNGYYTSTNLLSGVEAFRLVQPPVHALLNAYQTFRASTPNTSGTLSSASVIYPTSNSKPSLVQMGNQTNGLDTCGQGAVSAGGKNESEMRSELGGTTDENKPISSETQSVNQQTIVLIVRLLMSGKEVGSIIGKRGENVKKYREESGARINISDGSSPERIVTITGTTEQIFTAFTLMSQKFEDDFTQGLLRMGDEGLTCPPVTLRLLVPATQCGSIIGKGGSRIKDVREFTGASIQVASEALPTSTERTVTISGTAKAIAKCIRHLCEIFIESPAKGPVIPYRPKPAFTSHSALCTPTAPPPFSGSLISPTLPFPASGSENVIDQGFNAVHSDPSLMLTCGNTIGSDTANPAPSPVPQSYVGPFGLQPKYPQVSPALTGPGDASASALPANRNPALMHELLTDPIQLSTALNYQDFSTNPIPWLGALPTSALGIGTLPNPIINPLPGAFTFPEVAINQSLLGFYSPQAFPGLDSEGSQVYAGSQTMLSTSGNLTDEASAATPNGNENPYDQQEMRPAASSVTDLYTANPVLSLVQPSCFSPINGSSLNTSPISPIPVLQNKPSLLGLPTVPLPAFLNAATTGFHVLADETVIKEIIISNELIGCIIGRGGTTINEIRNISKAQIKISNCEDGARERKITLSGQPQAVNLAQFLISNSIAVHQQMWAFNVQLASAATALMTSTRLTHRIGSNCDRMPEPVEADHVCISNDVKQNTNDCNADGILSSPAAQEEPLGILWKSAQCPQNKVSTRAIKQKARRANLAPY